MSVQLQPQIKRNSRSHFFLRFLICFLFQPPLFLFCRLQYHLFVLVIAGKSHIFPLIYIQTSFITGQLICVCCNYNVNISFFFLIHNEMEQSFQFNNIVKPHTTKVACFQSPLGGRTAFPRYGLNSDTYPYADISSAFKLINVENVQVLLLTH